jgi:hypothetical protein
MQVVSPPSPVSAINPQLSEVLVEMVRFKVPTANSAPISMTAEVRSADDIAGPEHISEQSTLVLTLIDSLAVLPLPLVGEWLPIAAEIISLIADPLMRQPATRRLLEILQSGEMDVERSVIAVSWWHSGGGRELVAGSGTTTPYMMSGALTGDENLPRL